MHYKNGTPAKDGDHVLMKRWNGQTVAGVLHGTNAGAVSCNGQVSFIIPGGNSQECITVGDIFSAADAFKAMERRVATKPEVLAGLMYETYCAAVGGKAFNGDMLPSWEVFRADPAKELQSSAWIKAAELSLVTS